MQNRGMTSPRTKAAAQTMPLSFSGALFMLLFTYEKHIVHEILKYMLDIT